ncbi:hypothetical protein HU200_015921 [Digitaria exilis]|uniref:F-box domain-containing protein n=1 Tax=Digitaria exilis TaxID=1010633 RepID=A0A835F989_9POAL|nr:hypothetical protein HU200_015921 [Digitaria exilis]
MSTGVRKGVWGGEGWPGDGGGLASGGGHDTTTGRAGSMMGEAFCVLPEDALYEILLRLPGEDLCRLRAGQQAAEVQATLGKAGG